MDSKAKTETAAELLEIQMKARCLRDSRRDGGDTKKPM
jgi:hypothetical protein